MSNTKNLSQKELVALVTAAFTSAIRHAQASANGEAADLDIEDPAEAAARVQIAESVLSDVAIFAGENLKQLLPDFDRVQFVAECRLTEHAPAFNAGTVMRTPGLESEAPDSRGRKAPKAPGWVPKHQDVVYDEATGKITGRAQIGGPDSELHQFSASPNLFAINMAMSLVPHSISNFMSQADGYGEAGYFPGGYDWSGIRDSSDDSKAFMFETARHFLAEYSIALETLGNLPRNLVDAITTAGTPLPSKARG